MSRKSDIRTEAERLRKTFEARGAEVFEPSILQPAGALLGLYGEEIRARAFVTQDPLRGEMMLRPDFTVPLVEAHMAAGRTEARYTYAGEVFRRQEEDESRPTEYIQVGYEVFGGGLAVEADAEVFAAMSWALAGLPLTPSIGDMGVLRAAVMGLDTPDRRKQALLRHLWRPARFKALLERFSREAPAAPEMVGADVPHVGLRSREAVEARLALLAEEAETAPITEAELERLNAILAVEDRAPAAVKALAALAGDDAGLRAAVDQVDARLDAMADLRVDPVTLMFEASYGRTSLEYYGGFVFGFSAGNDWPVVATGGRYDDLASALGDGRDMPAVGGVIRPEAVLALKEGRL